MIHPRVQLISAEVVATMRGISCEAVHQQVDTEDGWMWVWNVGTGGERALRFWTREQLEPVAVRSLSLDAVIRLIAPPRQLTGGWQKWEVGELLRVSRRHLQDLDIEFMPRNGGMFVAHELLTAFLRRRWLFTHAYCEPKLL